MTNDRADDPRCSAMAVRETVARAIALGMVLLATVSPVIPSLGGDGTLLALSGVVAAIVIRDGDVRGLGFRAVPERGWGHWCCFALAVGTGIGIVVLLFSAVVWYGGWKWPIPRTNPQWLVQQIFWMCLYAPFVEELIFRSLVAVAVEPSLGETGTIVISGSLFAAGHILAGNASPENQLAGFFFAWAFLRSRTILVPMAMHSAGNAVAVAAQLLNWYFLPETTP